MKKIAFFSLILALGMAACKKESVVDFQQLEDEALATAIADDRSKQEIDPSTLPAEVLNYLDENHFDTYIDAAYFAEGKGYDIQLATEEHAYFNLGRRALTHRLNERLGPCGRLMGGRPIPVDSLRPAIVQYIETHYPDADILRAKRQGPKVIVLLSGQILLVFSADGVFEVDSQHWVDCRACSTDAIDQIPANVVAEIENRIPGAEIKRLCRRGDRFVIGVTANDQRHILVYDKNWNFLFAIP
ncbi:MAG: PepSY-like domain-containing protein [Saprospiraceae bacterium]|nr:PepSY-like domain-containing protein [Saprospiraceae bacterium]